MEKENLVYKVTDLWVDNDERMKFTVLLDITEAHVVIEGWYKLKLDGMSNYKKIAEKRYNIAGTTELTFDALLKELYDSVKERIAFVSVVSEFFKDRDRVEIVT